MKEFIDKKSIVVNVLNDTFVKTKNPDFTHGNFSDYDSTTVSFTSQEDDNEYFDDTIQIIKNSLVQYNYMKAPLCEFISFNALSVFVSNILD